jgi:CheY-like chemotaxis protein
LCLMATRKNIEFNFSNRVQQQYWQGDATRIKQILLNIGSNAIKFTESGSVTLSASYDETQQHLVFAIKDTGIGIELAQQRRLFQRFEQADSSTTRKFGGSGLGLSITYSLVALMNGKVAVESELGQGTTFIVSLPVNKAKAPEIKQKSENAEAINFAGKTILVAEDNEINRMVVEGMLAPTQANLIFACNGLAAVTTHKENLPDVILMDIQMPEMDGVEACRKIKFTHPNTPIIALTANAMNEDIKKYEQEGFDGYLAKPVEMSTLLDKLKQTLLG